MQSPELLLSDLNRSLLDLIAATVTLSDQELAQELRDVTRRLVLAEVLADTQIIAIGGSQGAGKTTLVLSLYGLEGGAADWLRANEGRGERLPVLILEDDGCTSPRGALRELGPLDSAGERFGVVERWVEVAEFQAAVRDTNTNVVLPVLYVPRTYFCRFGQAFLLLPGYERLDRDNDAWQQLMRQALVGAVGQIVVTDETRLAGEQQQEIVRDMLAEDLRGAAPLIIISKTEGLASNPARMAEVRSRAAEVFQVPEGEAEWRLHCIGASDPSYRSEWLPRLRQGLDELSIAGTDARQAQLARLHKVLENDLGQVIRLARMRARLYFGGGGDEDDAAEVVSRILEAFDEAKQEVEVDFKKAVSMTVASHGDRAWSAMQDTLTEEHEGLMSKIRALGDTVSEQHRKLVTGVEEAWRSQGNVAEYLTMHTANITQRRLASPLVKDATTLNAPPSGNVLMQLGYVRDDGKTIVQWGRPNDDDIRNLQVMLSPPGADTPKVATKELESSVRLLPALALEYTRLASLVPAAVGVDPNSFVPLPTSDVTTALKSMEQQFSQVQDLSKSILRGVAMVMALDVGIDGELDSLPALIGAMTGHTATVNAGVAGSTAAAAGGSATTAATGAVATGMTVAAAAVGVIAVGYLTHSALQEIRRHDGQVRSAAQQMLASISDHHQAHFTSHFHELMGQVRQHLKTRMYRRYRLDEKLMKQDRLAKALADVAGGRQDLLEKLSLSGRSLLMAGM